MQAQQTEEKPLLLNSKDIWIKSLSIQKVFMSVSKEQQKHNLLRFNPKLLQFDT